MSFFVFTLGLLFSPKFVVGNFSYEGNNGPSSWGNEYKSCAGKYQSPIDIEEKDVTVSSFPPLRFSGLQNSHTAHMTNNGHTVMIKSFDPDMPEILGGPMNDTHVFQQLHFHWGQSDELGSEDLINNHSFSMELHAVFWKKSYGSPDEAMKHDDGLTVLGYLYQATDKPNSVFDAIVSLIPDVTAVNSNVTISDNNILSKLIAPDVASAQHYYTYKGSLTTPPCLEIVQWIDFMQPQTISHAQLAAFRGIQSADGTNLTHNFRPVQDLDGRIVYRNNGTDDASETTTGSTQTTVSAPTTSQSPTTATPTSVKTTKKPEQPHTVPPTKQDTETPPPEHHSGQQSMWIVSPFVAMFGIIFLLSYQ